MVKLPCAVVGPFTKLAVKLAPPVFLSFVKTLPDTAFVPPVDASTVA